MAESLELTWDSSLATGERSIDAQHKAFIEIVNELARAIESKRGALAVDRILTLMRRYAAWHFEREECCMERLRCPFAEANKKAHCYFVATFEKFQQEYRASGGSQDLALRLYQELTDWLLHHIRRVDGEIRRSLVV
jgi:hemerythrin